MVRGCILKRGVLPFRRYGARVDPRDVSQVGPIVRGDVEVVDALLEVDLHPVFPVPPVGERRLDRIGAEPERVAPSGLHLDVVIRGPIPLAEVGEPLPAGEEALLDARVPGVLRHCRRSRALPLDPDLLGSSSRPGPGEHDGEQHGEEDRRPGACSRGRRRAISGRTDSTVDHSVLPSTRELGILRRRERHAPQPHAPQRLASIDAYRGSRHVHSDGGGAPALKVAAKVPERAGSSLPPSDPWSAGHDAHDLISPASRSSWGSAALLHRKPSGARTET